MQRGGIPNAKITHGAIVASLCFRVFLLIALAVGREGRVSAAYVAGTIKLDRTDNALQTLFAASVLLASLRDTLPEVSPETTSILIKTEQAMDRAIRQLREHLQS